MDLNDWNAPADTVGVMVTLYQSALGINRGQFGARKNGSTDTGNRVYRGSGETWAESAKFVVKIAGCDANGIVEVYHNKIVSPPEQIFITAFLLDTDAVFFDNFVVLGDWRGSWTDANTWIPVDMSSVDPGPTPPAYIINMYNGHWGHGNFRAIPNGDSTVLRNLPGVTKFETHPSSHFICTGNGGDIEIVSYDTSANMELQVAGYALATSGVTRVLPAGNINPNATTPLDWELRDISSVATLPSDAVVTAFSVRSNSSGSVSGVREYPPTSGIDSTDAYTQYPYFFVEMTSSLTEIEVRGKWTDIMMDAVFVGSSSSPPVAPNYPSRFHYVGNSVNVNLATGWQNADPDGYTVDQLPAGLSMSPQGLATGTPTTPGATVVTVSNLGLTSGGSRMNAPPGALWYDDFKRPDETLGAAAGGYVLNQFDIGTSPANMPRVESGVLAGPNPASGSYSWADITYVPLSPSGAVSFTLANDWINSTTDNFFGITARNHSPTSYYYLQVVGWSASYDLRVFRSNNGSLTTLATVSNGQLPLLTGDRIRWEINGLTHRVYYETSGSGNPQLLLQHTDTASVGTPFETARGFSLYHEVTTSASLRPLVADLAWWPIGGYQPYNILNAFTTGTFTWNILTKPVPPAYPPRVTGKGVPVSFNAATGWTNAEPNGYSSNGLPAGLSMTSAGLVTGTPTTVATYSVTISNNTSAGQISAAPFSWDIVTVATPPAYSDRVNSQGIAVNVDLSVGWVDDNPTGFSAVGLPAGTSMDTSGVVTGTPSTTGPTSVTVSNDNFGAVAPTDADPFTWTIYALPIAPAYGPITDKVDDPVNRDLSVGWTDPYPGGFSATALPTGLTMNTSGVVTGTPTVLGVFNTIVSNTSPVQTVSAAAFDWTISSNLVPPAYDDRYNYTGDSVNADLGTGWNISFGESATLAVTFSATGLPPATSMNASTGVVTGTVTTPGTYSVTVTAVDVGDPVDAAPFDWFVLNKPVAPVYGTLTGRVGTPVNEDLAVGWTDANPTGFSALLLPAGLSMNSAGLVTGTPTTVQSRGVVVRNTTPISTISAPTFSWNILAAIAPPTYGNRANFVGAVVSFNAATGWTAPEAGQWSATDLPAGLSIAASNGLVTGTVLAPAAGYSTVITNNGVSAAPFTWTIVEVPVPPVYPPRTDRVGDSVSFNAATGWVNANPTGFSATSRPSGLAITAAGTIFGTPTTVQVRMTVVTNTTAAGAVSADAFTWTIDPEIPPATPPTYQPRTDYINAALSVNLATGWQNADPNGFAVDQLPTGLTMNAQGVVSGTPTVLGQTVVTVSNTNGAGTFFAAPFTWDIVDPPPPEISFPNAARIAIGIKISL